MSLRLMAGQTGVALLGRGANNTHTRLYVPCRVHAVEMIIVGCDFFFCTWCRLLSVLRKAAGRKHRFIISDICKAPVAPLDDY